MRKNFFSKMILSIAALALLTSVPFSVNQASNLPTRYRFLIEAKGPGKVRRLSGWLNENQFDVAGVDLPNGTIEVLTDEKGMKLLKARGLDGRLTQLPIQGGNLSGALRLDPRYMDPAKVAARMQDLHVKYPTVTRVIEYGRTLNQLPLLALVISTTPDLDDSRFHEKPTVLVDGMHHAREIMTPEIVFDIGETLLGAANLVRAARSVLEGMNIVLVPMINMDGNARVWDADRMWRKNARADGAHVFGVDVNRNYPYQWAGCRGSSGMKEAQDYRGASAASEPETRALMDLAERIRPMASLSYHSFGELLLYPYGCKGDFTGENALLEKLGKEMGRLLPNEGGSGYYTVGTPWQIIYGVDGDSMGYLFAAFGAVTYTFEVNREFQPAYSLREPTLKKHRPAWGYFFDQIQQRLATITVKDANGNPAVAILDIAQIPHRKGEREFRTNTSAHYFKVLLPGKYTVRAKTQSGLVGETSFVMGERPETVALTVR